MSKISPPTTTPPQSSQTGHSVTAAFWATAITIVVLFCSFTMSQQFKEQEQKLSENHVREELLVLSQNLYNQIDSTVIALRRMAQRWGSYGGTTREQWLDDVNNYIDDFESLTTVEWVDNTYHVRWVEPLEGNEKAIGLNIIFDDERKKALEGAAEEHALTLTPPLEMVQGYRAFISYAPIYIDDEFEGFIAGIYNTDIFFKSLLSDDETKLLNLRVTDNDKVIYQNADDDAFEVNFADTKTIPLFNREWLVTVSPKPALLTSDKTFLPEITLLGGTLFALLIGFAVYIAQIAHYRNQMLQEKSLKLAQANAEMEEYAYRISHDLRSPIISSIGLIELCQKALIDDRKDVAKTSLDHVRGSLSKLITLIEDILALTQIKNQEEQDVEVDIEALIDDALDKFSHLENFERLDTQKDLQYTAPLLLKKSRITLIIENMITNSIKYQDLGEEQSCIKILTYKDKKNFVFRVEDNGLGIPKEQQKNLFAMFKRFHTNVSFGSGLGLYMMKKSADILGGWITFEELDKGTAFTFTVPVN